MIYSTQTNGYTLEGNYRANPTSPFHLYIRITITINTQAHLVLEKYFIVPRKRHFLWREIILHQKCKSTLKQIISLLPHVAGHTQCSSMPEELIGAIKKRKQCRIRDKMHLKISELALHFTKIHKLMILEQFTVKC